MAEPYPDAGAWLEDAARRFGARITILLAAEARCGADLLGPFIPLAEAAALARGVTDPGPAGDPAADPAADSPIAQWPAIAALPVGRLLRAFALPPSLAPLFALMLAAERDPRFTTLFAYLHDDSQRRQLTPALAQRLLGPPPLPWSLLLAADGPLRSGEMLQLERAEDRPLPDRALRWTDPMAAFLMDERATVDPALAGHLHRPPVLPLALLIPDPSVRTALEAAAAAGPIALTGRDGSGRAATAAALARSQGREPLAIRLPALASEADAGRRFRIALREAALHGRTLVLIGADTLAPAVQRAAIIPPDLPLIFVASGRLERDLPGFALPALDAERTRALWRHLLGAHRAEEADTLAHRFRLPVEDMAAVAAEARDANLARLSRACLDRSSGALAGLATPVELRHDWDDLVLPERQLAGLRAIIARGSHARQVYDDWGLGLKLAPSRGLTALFSGPSGAGKTLSAGVVAAKLGLPLYRVDLSATVSKYIGETEKNLEQIFAAAESGNACLFFDECDALFGKRSEVSDAHDRYANIETSYLLQRLERHRGIVILASNYPQNIDDAFSRRIDINVEFTMPDAALRVRLWERLIPPQAEAEIDCELLGRQFELSGGAIRNCILTAAFLAAQDGTRITTAHCVRAVAQEYEKAGKPLTRMAFGDAFGALRSRAER